MFEIGRVVKQIYIHAVHITAILQAVILLCMLPKIMKRVRLLLYVTINTQVILCCYRTGVLLYK